jgi:glutathione S-transferase
MQLVNAINSPLGLPPMPDLAARARDALAAPMKRLDDLLADGRPFVAGEYPSLADCTLQAAFQFARFREIEILDGYAQLARWDAAYRERDPARSVLVV